MEAQDYSFPVRLVEQGTDWLGWVAAIAGLITLAIVGVSLRYARRSVIHARSALDDARKTRYGQLIFDIGTVWSSRDIAESKELMVIHGQAGIAAHIEALWGPSRIPPSKARTAVLEQFVHLARLPNLIELIGGLAVEGVLTPRVIYTMWGGGILGAWLGWEDAIRLLRVYEKEADSYANFEWIAGQMRTINEQRQPP